MKILLDNCVPAILAKEFVGHEVVSAKLAGYAELSNGELLRAAESDGTQVVITIDARMRFQSSLKGLKLCVAVIEKSENSQTKLLNAVSQILEKLDGLEGSQFHVFQPKL